MTASAGRSAALVAAGIFVSRLLGFVRERVFAHYFGSSAAADAVRAAFRIPNAIRNLLGEGTLSASFIPVYARLVESDDPRAARALAASVASVLLVATAAASLAGIALAPAITAAIAPGFDLETRRLTTTLVRIMFPMSGLLILAGWCLGVLNTHRRYFLPYAAPTLWNVAQIAAMAGLGGYFAGGDLAVWLAWGTLAGAVLQLAVQLPAAVRLAGGLTFSPSIASRDVRRVLTAWTPVVIGAGVVQISSFVDTFLASFLPEGAVASLGYAQLLTNLPIALFGVSIAASALPELSREADGQDSSSALRSRLADGFRRITFFVLPCAVAFAVIGEPAVRLLYETGRFGARETSLVTGVLAAYSLGLVSYAAVKLLASGFYALQDTRTPVLIAGGSVVLSGILALALMRRYGPAGIALGSALAATVSTVVHLIVLERRVGPVVRSDDARALAITAGACAAAAAAALLARSWQLAPGTAADFLLSWVTFGSVFLAVTYSGGHPDARRLAQRRDRAA